MSKRKITYNLNPLNKIDYTKLSFEQIIADLKSIIESHPEYKSLWQDFLAGNAGQMLLETFAFIAQNIINRVDLIANELTLSTAKDPTTIVNLLKLIGYNLSPPICSVVSLLITNKSGEPMNLEIFPGYQIQGSDLNGESMVFEIMKEENDYDSIVEIDNKVSDTVKAYSGEKRVSQVSVETKENFSFDLTDSNIIKGSVRIYLQLNESEEVLLKEMDSLVLASEAEDDIYPKYTIKYNYDFSAKVSFGKQYFGGQFSNVVDGYSESYEQLRVVYRVNGRGADGNVPANSINTTLSLGAYSVEVSNPSAAIGGSSGESVDDAKRIAPLTTKTVNKTVTPEDYTTLLRSQSIVSIWTATIDSPYVHSDRVPFLFNYIYVAPQRTWSNFRDEMPGEETEESLAQTIPTLLTNENKSTYIQRFLIRLNNFLNIQGCCDLTQASLSSPNISIEEYEYNNSSLKFPEEYPKVSESYKLYYDFLLDKKITGVENLIRIAKFSPFKISGTLYYKSGVNSSTLKESVKLALRSEYGIDNRLFGENIQISKIFGLIHGIEGVSYFNMTYPSQDLTADTHEMLFLLPEEIVDQLDGLISNEFDIDIVAKRI